MTLINHYMDAAQATEAVLLPVPKRRSTPRSCEPSCHRMGMQTTARTPILRCRRGLLTSVVLLLADYCRRIENRSGGTSCPVFKLVQELLAPSGVRGKNWFYHALMRKAAPGHKARWFAGAALNTSDQAMASVAQARYCLASTPFWTPSWSEVLCFDSCMNAERFAAEKSAIFYFAEEDQTKKPWRA